MIKLANEHALGLYASLGFVPTTTEDYDQLPISRQRALLASA